MLQVSNETMEKRLAANVRDNHVSQRGAIDAAQNGRQVFLILFLLYVRRVVIRWFHFFFLEIIAKILFAPDFLD